MSPVHWLIFIFTFLPSLGVAFYGRWVLMKYALPSYRTGVTGCEIARFILDHAGLIQISINPLEKDSLTGGSAEVNALEMDRGTYEGKDFLSILEAARQAFLKIHLANVTFWAHIKKRSGFMIRMAVIAGWALIALGAVVPGAGFLATLGLGIFIGALVVGIFELPFELQMEEETSQLLKRSGYFQPNELIHLKKLNMAASFWGLACIIRAPFDPRAYFFQKNGKVYGV